jgi:hypothetical protein
MSAPTPALATWACAYPEPAAALTIRTNLTDTLAGDDCSGCRNCDRFTGAHVDAGVHAATITRHVNTAARVGLPRGPPPVLSRFRERTPATILFTRVDTALAANADVETSVRVGVGPAIRCQEQTAIAFGGEFSGAAELDNRRACVIADSPRSTCLSLALGQRRAGVG